MSLYHKYRPQKLDDIFGNEETIKVLKNTLNKEEVPHSFLFHGPTGCGKTTLGRIVANELGCVGHDLREIDSADFRGIDTIREIRRNSNYKSLEGPCRVWILDECHQLSRDAQSGLLKILEDTPSHVYFILCTTDPQKLLGTIRGRCTQFQVNPLTSKEMLFLLRKVIHGEGEKLTGEIYHQIAESSQGHPRNALQILEQVLMVGEEERLAIAEKAAEVQEQVLDLCRSLLNNNGWKKVANILKSLQEQNEQPESIRRTVLGYCQSVLLKGVANDMAGVIMENFKTPFYDTGFPGLTFACYAAVRAVDAPLEEDEN